LQNKEYVENKIELMELFEIIGKKRYFIIIFTLIVTGLALIYVIIKTPIYQVKALVEIGSYKTEKNSSIEEISLEDVNQLVKKLSTVFIDLRKNDENKKVEIVSIIIPKGMNKFLEITSEGISNELAVGSINEVLSYIQNEHKKTLDDVKEKNNLEIKNTNLIISNIENERIINIDKKIDLHEKNILALEEQMKFVNETLKNINSLDSSFAALKLMEKRDISNEITINKSTLYDLNETKKTLLNIDINKLLERKKLLETLHLPHNIKNSEIVGDVQIDENPIKPKKALLVVVVFITGLIFSIFIVFFMQFINNVKKEKE
jgi:LPS O-antigen subunit length determinant protein (WzzB/FepE family)